MDLHVQKMFGLNIFILLLLLPNVLEGYDGKCEKITVQQCRERYNFTHIPNDLLGIESQREAEIRVSEFGPLFKINCAPLLRFFICSMFVPMCFKKNEVPTVLYACRPMCEQARLGCEPIMKKYGFDWPANLACERLPWVSTSKRLCMSAPKLNWTYSSGDKYRPNKRNYSLSMKELCLKNPKFIYIGDRDNEICARKCNASISFNDADKKFAEVWITTWAIICFISTLLTVSTFLIDSARFRYPERPIIFLSMCYNIYSVGYLVRTFAGRDKVICENSMQGKHLVYDGMTNTACTIVFFFSYFFGMASAIWWVILALTWFLSAALKWGHEAVEKYSSVFHAIAWAIPTVQTIVALVTRKVDAEELTGLCYIGTRNSITLLWFVVIPLFVYLLLGTSFLLAGFISLFRIRRTLRVKETNIHKLEKLMIRIGIFSLLYSLPAGFVVGCYLNDYFNLKNLEKHATDIITCYENVNCRNKLKPDPGLLYLKHFMLLVVGVTSGVWIWSTKTLASWKQFYAKCCGSETPHDKRKQHKRQVANTNRIPGNVQNNGHNIYYQPSAPVTVQNPIIPLQTIYPISMNQVSGKPMPYFTTAHSVVSQGVSQPSHVYVQSNQGFPLPVQTTQGYSIPAQTSNQGYPIPVQSSNQGYSIPSQTVSKPISPRRSTSHTSTSQGTSSASASGMRSDSEMGMITSVVRL